MKRPWIAGLALAALLGLSGNLHAQFGGYSRPRTSPYYRPAVSPYVNLNNGFNSTGVNYFGIVRPQEQGYMALQRLQHEVEHPLFGSTLSDGSLNPLAGNPRDPQQQALISGVSGHAVQFFNYGHYYNLKPRQGGGQ